MTPSGRSAPRGPAPRNDAWRVIGPGGGGTMISPTVSPHDKDLACLFCDMTGAYLTRDGGDSWRMFNLRNWVTCFAFDPSDPKVIYAANAALWRSDDAGATWRMVWPDPARSVEHMRGDHADYRISSEDPSYPSRDCKIDAVAVDPSDSKRLFLAARISARHSGEPDPSRPEGPMKVIRCDDGGKTWRVLTELPAQDVHEICAGAGGSTVYVVGSAGVAALVQGQWRTLPGPDGRSISHASCAWPRGAKVPTLYATTRAEWRDGRLSGGVYVSADGGATWTAAAPDLSADLHRPGEGPPPHFRAVACCAGNPRVAYVSTGGVRTGPGERDGLCGVLRTGNGGRSWSWVLREDESPAANMEFSWIERRSAEGNPNILFVAPSSLGVAPTDAEVCFASDGWRTFRTRDGGKTWKQAYARRVNSVDLGGDRWTTTGLDVTTCYGVHFDPFDPRGVFISYTDIGLFASRDGGDSWTGATVGIPAKWRNTTYWVEFDPEVRGLMWGAFAFHHDLPRPKMWQHRTGPLSYEGGVAVSVDGGRSWTLSSNGVGETAATHIVLDPDSPVGRRTLYVCGFARGVFKSTDNGRSWTLKNKGLPGPEPFAWRLARAGDGTLYLVLARRSDYGRAGDGGDGSLYVSTDGAETWKPLPLPAGVNGPVGLTLDPRDRNRMYLSAWALSPRDGANTGGGVFLSADGGRSWRCILDQTQHAYDVTVDPRNPDVLYCCGFESSAYRSDDRGATWQRLSGYNFHWGHRVIPDPADPEKVYITTYGGSVWHGPARGDPDAPEDILTPLPHRP